MDANTARTLNIRRIVKETGGPAAFASRYGAGRWAQPQVSQWIGDEPKSIGKKLARDLEVEIGLPFGALDYFEEEASAAKEQGAPGFQMAFVDRVVGATLSAGAGEVLWDFEQVDRSHAFRLDWMQSNGFKAERCKVWTVRGDSMQDKYPGGSWVLINMGEREPVHGKNFALIGEDGLRLKQLRRTPTGWEMYSLTSDQNKYPPEPIIDDNYAIIGRVRAHGGSDD